MRGFCLRLLTCCCCSKSRIPMAIRWAGSIRRILGKGAAAAYQQVSVPNTTNMIPGYSTASVAGQLQIAAQGATVDINDSVMTNNLQALGTIRANQTARQTDIANLEAATQSQDVSQQTIMAELQRINQALLLQLRTFRTQTRSMPILPCSRSLPKSSNRTR
jgi:hypothetical protein